MPSHDSRRDDLLGVVIADRYRIISHLGEGGMGVTYRAWDKQAGVPVVVKIPKRSLLQTPGVLERFSREVKALQGLKHSHIVPVVGAGEHDGLPFVVMPFLPGGSLSNRRLRDEQGQVRPNPPGMLHLWLPAVADALDHVHSNGLVHRDVKPGNIFFDAFWGAFLGDFGIAKIVGESDAFDREHTLTATNMGIGTPEYMGPELFVPKPILDGRTDQYALAVIVYEMLTGTRPFKGDKAHIVVEITSQPPPRLDALRPGLPSSLVAAVHRGLAKSQQERFSTCQDFVQAALQNVPPLQDEAGVSRFLCPACGNMLKLPVGAVGKKGRCPRCKSEMRVAEGLSALWLTSEELAGTSLSSAQEDSDPTSQPISWDELSSEPITKQTQETNPVKRLWNAATPAVRWTAIGAAAVIALVLEAVLVHDWSTSSLREQLAQAQAAAKSATLRVDQLGVDNVALKKEVASITAEAAMLKDTTDTLRQENAKLTQELAARNDKKKDEMPEGDSGIQSAANAPSSDTLVNSIGIKLKLIPAGTFMMGEAGSSNEKPHRVTLTKPFYMGVHEVTNAQWKQVMGGVPSEWKADSHPVELVSWDDAVEFCRKLSALPEERKAGRMYRLPTEAEWEYAGRAGTTTKYSFGDDESLLGDYGWFDDNSARQSHPVGQKKPNAWGLYDMHGNVWEWCSDWYGDYSDGEVTDPKGPSSGSSRVFRGDGWGDSAGDCRSAYRNGFYPLVRQDDIGFRLALSPSGAESPEAGTEQGTKISAPPEGSTPAAGNASVVAPPSAVAVLTLPETIASTVGIRLKLIPAGAFTMGDAGGGSDEKPPHRVTLTKPFYMGVYEVTNAQWKQVMGSVPSNWKEEDNPVEQVSWENAVEFCRKLSALPEERKAGRVYRLPTEAEWEYACRAGATTKYAFGDDEKLLGDYGWFDGKSGNQTQSVGQKKPNAWGLYDMHGNVWEWCSDWYGIYPDGEVTNPEGPSSGSDRVLRGGGWSFPAGGCRSAFRYGSGPSDRSFHLGFRLALSPSGAESPEAGK
jgi:formylglycine-generating enzyme required for sulfatase activity/serine/threonine protein kinase